MQTVRTEPGLMKYVAAPADDQVIKAGAGILYAVILGDWVTGGTIEISDHLTTGDANVVIELTAGLTDESGFPKTIPVNAKFRVGIVADITGLKNVTFLYK